MQANRDFPELGKQDVVTIGKQKSAAPVRPDKSAVRLGGTSEVPGRAHGERRLEEFAAVATAREFNPVRSDGESGAARTPEDFVQAAQQLEPVFREDLTADHVEAYLDLLELTVAGDLGELHGTLGDGPQTGPKELISRQLIKHQLLVRELGPDRAPSREALHAVGLIDTWLRDLGPRDEAGRPLGPRITEADGRQWFRDRRLRLDVLLRRVTTALARPGDHRDQALSELRRWVEGVDVTHQRVERLERDVAAPPATAVRPQEPAGRWAHLYDDEPAVTSDAETEPEVVTLPRQTTAPDTPKVFDLTEEHEPPADAWQDLRRPVPAPETAPMRLVTEYEVTTSDGPREPGDAPFSRWGEPGQREAEEFPYTVPDLSLVEVEKPPLEVAGDGSLAIAEGWGAREFYATEEVVRQANKQLTRGGAVTLRLHEGTFVKFVQDDKVRTLYKVTPEVRGGAKTLPYSQRHLIQESIGTNLTSLVLADARPTEDGGTRQVRLVDSVFEVADELSGPSGLAGFLLDLLGAPDTGTASLDRAAEVARSQFTINEKEFPVVGKEFGLASNPGNGEQHRRLAGLTQQIGVNRFAHAVTGEAYVAQSLATHFENGERDYTLDYSRTADPEPRTVTSRAQFGAVVATSHDGNNQIVFTNLVTAADVQKRSLPTLRRLLDSELPARMTERETETPARASVRKLLDTLHDLQETRRRWGPAVQAQAETGFPLPKELTWEVLATTTDDVTRSRAWRALDESMAGHLKPHQQAAPELQALDAAIVRLRKTAINQLGLLGSFPKGGETWSLRQVGRGEGETYHDRYGHGLGMANPLTLVAATNRRPVAFELTLPGGRLDQPSALRIGRMGMAKLENRLDILARAAIRDVNDGLPLPTLTLTARLHPKEDLLGYQHRMERLATEITAILDRKLADHADLLRIGKLTAEDFTIEHRVESRPSEQYQGNAEEKLDEFVAEQGSVDRDGSRKHNAQQWVDSDWYTKPADPDHPDSVIGIAAKPQDGQGSVPDMAERLGAAEEIVRFGGAPGELPSGVSVGEFLRASRAIEVAHQLYGEFGESLPIRAALYRADELLGRIDQGADAAGNRSGLRRPSGDEHRRARIMGSSRRTTAESVDAENSRLRRREEPLRSPEDLDRLIREVQGLGKEAEVGREERLRLVALVEDARNLYPEGQLTVARLKQVARLDADRSLPATRVARERRYDTLPEGALRGLGHQADALLHGYRIPEEAHGLYRDQVARTINAGGLREAGRFVASVEETRRKALSQVQVLTHGTVAGETYGGLQTGAESLIRLWTDYSAPMGSSSATGIAVVGPKLGGEALVVAGRLPRIHGTTFLFAEAELHDGLVTQPGEASTKKSFTPAMADELLAEAGISKNETVSLVVTAGEAKDDHLRQWASELHRVGGWRVRVATADGSVFEAGIPRNEQHGFSVWTPNGEHEGKPAFRYGEHTVAPEVGTGPDQRPFAVSFTARDHVQDGPAPEQMVRYSLVREDGTVVPHTSAAQPQAPWGENVRPVVVELDGRGSVTVHSEHGRTTELTHREAAGLAVAVLQHHGHPAGDPIVVVSRQGGSGAKEAARWISAALKQRQVFTIEAPVEVTWHNDGVSLEVLRRENTREPLWHEVLTPVGGVFESFQLGKTGALGGTVAVPLSGGRVAYWNVAMPDNGVKAGTITGYRSKDSSTVVPVGRHSFSDDFQRTSGGLTEFPLWLNAYAIEEARDEMYGELRVDGEVDGEPVYTTRRIGWEKPPYVFAAHGRGDTRSVHMETDWGTMSAPGFGVGSYLKRTPSVTGLPSSRGVFLLMCEAGLSDRVRASIAEEITDVIQRRTHATPAVMRAFRNRLRTTTAPDVKVPMLSVPAVDGFRTVEDGWRGFRSNNATKVRITESEQQRTRPGSGEDGETGSGEEGNPGGGGVPPKRPTGPSSPAPASGPVERAAGSGAVNHGSAAGRHRGAGPQPDGPGPARPSGGPVALTPETRTPETPGQPFGSLVQVAGRTHTPVLHVPSFERLATAPADGHWLYPTRDGWASAPRREALRQWRLLLGTDGPAPYPGLQLPTARPSDPAGLRAWERTVKGLHRETGLSLVTAPAGSRVGFGHDGDPVLDGGQKWHVETEHLARAAWAGALIGTPGTDSRGRLMTAGQLDLVHGPAGAAPTGGAGWTEAWQSLPALPGVTSLVARGHQDGLLQLPFRTDTPVNAMVGLAEPERVDRFLTGLGRPSDEAVRLLFADETNLPSPEEYQALAEAHRRPVLAAAPGSVWDADAVAKGRIAAVSVADRSRPGRWAVYYPSDHPDHGRPLEVSTDEHGQVLGWPPVPAGQAVHHEPVPVPWERLTADRAGRTLDRLRHDWAGRELPELARTPLSAADREAAVRELRGQLAESVPALLDRPGTDEVLRGLVDLLHRHGGSPDVLAEFERRLRDQLAGESGGFARRAVYGSAGVELFTAQVRRGATPGTAVMELVADEHGANPRAAFTAMLDTGAGARYEVAAGPDATGTGQGGPLPFAGKPVYLVNGHGLPGMALPGVRDTRHGTTGDHRQAAVTGAHLADLVWEDPVFQELLTTHGENLQVGLLNCFGAEALAYEATSGKPQELVLAREFADRLAYHRAPLKVHASRHPVIQDVDGLKVHLSSGKRHLGTPQDHWAVHQGTAPLADRRRFGEVWTLPGREEQPILQVPPLTRADGLTPAAPRRPEAPPEAWRVTEERGERLNPQLHAIKAELKAAYQAGRLKLPRHGWQPSITWRLLGRQPSASAGEIRLPESWRHGDGWKVPEGWELPKAGQYLNPRTWDVIEQHGWWDQPAAWSKQGPGDLPGKPRVEATHLAPYEHGWVATDEAGALQRWRTVLGPHWEAGHRELRLPIAEPAPGSALGEPLRRTLALLKREGGFDTVLGESDRPGGNGEPASPNRPAAVKGGGVSVRHGAEGAHAQPVAAAGSGAANMPPARGDGAQGWLGVKVPSGLALAGPADPFGAVDTAAQLPRIPRAHFLFVEYAADGPVALREDRTPGRFTPEDAETLLARHQVPLDVPVSVVGTSGAADDHALRDWADRWHESSGRTVRVVLSDRTLHEAGPGEVQHRPVEWTRTVEPDGALVYSFGEHRVQPRVRRDAMGRPVGLTLDPTRRTTGRGPAPDLGTVEHSVVAEDGTHVGVRNDVAPWGADRTPFVVELAGDGVVNVQRTNGTIAELSHREAAGLVNAVLKDHELDHTTPIAVVSRDGDPEVVEAARWIAVENRWNRVFTVQAEVDVAWHRRGPALTTHHRQPVAERQWHEIRTRNGGVFHADHLGRDGAVVGLLFTGPDTERQRWYVPLPQHGVRSETITGYGRKWSRKAAPMGSSSYIDGDYLRSREGLTEFPAWWDRLSLGTGYDRHGGMLWETHRRSGDFVTAPAGWKATDNPYVFSAHGLGEQRSVMLKTWWGRMYFPGDQVGRWMGRRASLVAEDGRTPILMVVCHAAMGDAARAAIAQRVADETGRTVHAAVDQVFVFGRTQLDQHPDVDMPTLGLPLAQDGSPQRFLTFHPRTDGQAPGAPAVEAALRRAGGSAAANNLLGQGMPDHEPHWSAESEAEADGVVAMDVDESTSMDYVMELAALGYVPLEAPAGLIMAGPTEDPALTYALSNLPRVPGSRFLFVEGDGQGLVIKDVYGYVDRFTPQTAESLLDLYGVPREEPLSVVVVSGSVPDDVLAQWAEDLHGLGGRTVRVVLDDSTVHQVGYAVDQLPPVEWGRETAADGTTVYTSGRYRVRPSVVEDSSGHVHGLALGATHLTGPGPEPGPHATTTVRHVRTDGSGTPVKSETETPWATGPQPFLVELSGEDLVSVGLENGDVAEMTHREAAGLVKAYLEDHPLGEGRPIAVFSNHGGGEVEEAARWISAGHPSHPVHSTEARTQAHWGANGPVLQTSYGTEEFRPRWHQVLTLSGGVFRAEHLGAQGAVATTVGLKVLRAGTDIVPLRVAMPQNGFVTGTVTGYRNRQSTSLVPVGRHSYVPEELALAGRNELVTRFPVWWNRHAVYNPISGTRSAHLYGDGSMRTDSHPLSWSDPDRVYVFTSHGLAGRMILETRWGTGWLTGTQTGGYLKRRPSVMAAESNTELAMLVCEAAAPASDGTAGAQKVADEAGLTTHALPTPVYSMEPSTFDQVLDMEIPSVATSVDRTTGQLDTFRAFHPQTNGQAPGVPAVDGGPRRAGGSAAVNSPQEDDLFFHLPTGLLDDGWHGFAPVEGESGLVMPGPTQSPELTRVLADLPRIRGTRFLFVEGDGSSLVAADSNGVSKSFTPQAAEKSLLAMGVPKDEPVSLVLSSGSAPDDALKAWADDLHAESGRRVRVVLSDMTVHQSGMEAEQLPPAEWGRSTADDGGTTYTYGRHRVRLSALRDLSGQDRGLALGPDVARVEGVMSDSRSKVHHLRTQEAAVRAAESTETPWSADGEPFFVELSGEETVSVSTEDGNVEELSHREAAGLVTAFLQDHPLAAGRPIAVYSSGGGTGVEEAARWISAAFPGHPVYATEARTEGRWLVSGPYLETSHGLNEFRPRWHRVQTLDGGVFRAEHLGGQAVVASRVEIGRIGGVTTEVKVPMPQNGFVTGTMTGFRSKGASTPVAVGRYSHTPGELDQRATAMTDFPTWWDRHFVKELLPGSAPRHFTDEHGRGPATSVPASWTANDRVHLFAAHGKPGEIHLRTRWGRAALTGRQAGMYLKRRPSIMAGGPETQLGMLVCCAAAPGISGSSLAQDVSDESRLTSHASSKTIYVGPEAFSYNQIEGTEIPGVGVMLDETGKPASFGAFHPTPRPEQVTDPLLPTTTGQEGTGPAQDSAPAPTVSAGGAGAGPIEAALTEGVLPGTAGRSVWEALAQFDVFRGVGPDQLSAAAPGQQGTLGSGDAMDRLDALARNWGVRIQVLNRMTAGGGDLWIPRRTDGELAVYGESGPLVVVAASRSKGETSYLPLTLTS
ncbi:hypothetical protein [Kitasatospora sp. NPDC093102]|uniref:hypothetical protein n=1 Tax=Kitasatospora sp. NPDC093102 TaxID=3155069 RepID=UPI00341E05EA